MSLLKSESEKIITIGKVIFSILLFFTPIFLFYFKDASQNIFWLWIVFLFKDEIF